MNLSNTEAFALNKWQRCYFDFKSSDVTCAQKANALRGILSQVNVSHAAGSISSNGAVLLTKKYGGLLSSLVDSQTELNNYAEGALSLCSNHRNESQEWTSSLTSESLLQHECIQQILREAEDFKATAKEGSNIIVTNKPECARPLNVQKSYNPENVRSSSMQHDPGLPTSSNQPRDGYNRTKTFSTYTNSSNNSMFNPALSVFGNHLKPGLKEMEQSTFNSMTGGNGRSSVSQNNPNRTFYDSCSGPNNPNKRFYDSGSKNPVSDLGRHNQFGNRLFGSEMPQQQSGNKRKIHDMYSHQNAHGSRKPNTGGFEYDDAPQAKQVNNFVTARDQLSINNQKKNSGGRGNSSVGSTASYGASRKVLGTNRRGLHSKFVPPIMNKEDTNQERMGTSQLTSGSAGTHDDEPIDERLKNIDPKMIELVMNEVMDHGPPIHWDDIAGLEFAKATIKEIVVWPMLRPDIFHGLRGPPKGLLLFGPPGTGKTLIGKCIANQSGATFFSISASSLTSKWIGEGEKMVRALFAVSRCHQPAVIFIDEIDSLLSQRSADEHESSRRIKTEFLVQLDGATTNSEDRLLVVGATNRPHEIDEAARRRLVKRLYIPLPDAPARKQIVVNLLSKQAYVLNEEELNDIQRKTEGYSGADVANLCREAALGPVRCIKDIQQVSADQVRPILFEDFQAALKTVRPSVSQQDLKIYLEWNKQYGSGS
ncbi:fidgetin-like protein 1 isoform X2 [Anneissia japonica]|nr:fidgetin-like protein 1 isoform X2 [Anneissia japonica]